MSVEPSELVRRQFERWNSGDFEIREEETHPEIEIRSQTTDLIGEPYRGLDGVRAWVADVFQSFDEWDVRLDELGESVAGGSSTGSRACSLPGPRQRR